MAIDSPKNDFAEKHRFLTYADEPDTVYDGSKILDGSVTTDKIADYAVTTDKIDDESITTDKIADYAVTTDKIDDESITTDKLDDGIVTTPKLADGAVTFSKLDSSVTDTIEDLDNRTTTLENKILVVLGDSWSDGNNDPDNPWMKTVKEKMGYDAYITAAIAGKGFYYGGASSIPYQVANAVTAVENAGYSVNDVKTVIAFGGCNDFRHSVTYSNVSSSMQTTYNNAKTAFPNADVYIIGPNAGKWDTMDSLDSGDDKASNYVGIVNFLTSLKDSMHNSGYPIIFDSCAWLNMYGKNAGNCYNSDNLHPNQTGHNIIAAYMCEILEGSYTGCHYHKREKDLACSTSGITARLNYNLTVENGNATIQFEIISDTVVTTSSVWWIIDNFPLFPGGTSASAFKAGFVCSNFASTSMTDAYAPIRGFFNPTNRRITLYPDKTGGLNQVFGSFCMNIY